MWDLLIESKDRARMFTFLISVIHHLFDWYDYISTYLTIQYIYRNKIIFNSIILTLETDIDTKSIDINWQDFRYRYRMLKQEEKIGI